MRTDRQSCGTLKVRTGPKHRLGHRDYGRVVDSDTVVSVADTELKLAQSSLSGKLGLATRSLIELDLGLGLLIVRNKMHSVLVSLPGSSTHHRRDWFRLKARL